jgi:hypothetical protein
VAGIADPISGTAIIDFSAEVSATDNVDSNVSIVCDPPSGSTFSAGSTTVTCTASDDGPNASGVANTATAQFTVSVADNSPPVITLNGANPDSVDQNTVYADPGATATDNVDGSFAATATPLDTSVPGTFTITYTAVDSSGNAATPVTRAVTVNDTTAPVITLNPGLNTVDEDTPYTDPGATATDNFDGAFPATASGWDYDTSEPGVYTIYYDAVDTAGNPAAQQSRMVTVNDTTAPVIVLNGSNPDSVDQWTTYTDPGATATDNFDSSVSVSASGWDSDTSVPGTYTLTYTASDLAGNAATPINRNVTVNDKTPPVISAGDVIVSVDYVEPLNPTWGQVPDYAATATATDAIDGDVTVNCSRDDGNMTSDFGFSDTPYTINCTATDNNGNPASASYLLTVRYLYDINLIPPKGRARAGSTVPLDWQYLSWIDGNPIDGSSIDVRVSWAKMTDSSCTTRDLSSPEGTSGVGDDSGNSDFRYSSSNDTWQFSWQTPDVLGWHKVNVSPPGGNVENAWE